MAKTVVGLFDNFTEAQSAVSDLVNAGYSRDDISLAANRTASGYTGDGSDWNMTNTANEQIIGNDIGVGAGVGGLVGLLVGLGALTIPGVGPVLAAGPLAAALGTVVGSTAVGVGVGAAAGGLIGALTHLGIPQEHAEYYAEGVRRGGTLVSVAVSNTRSREAANILGSNGAVDIDQRRDSYLRRGYSGYNPQAAPYSSEEIIRERASHRSDPGRENLDTMRTSDVSDLDEDDTLDTNRRTTASGMRSHVSQ